MDERYKQLLELLKVSEDDIPDLTGLVSDKGTPLDISRRVRNLSENALGDLYLKNTGVSIPNIKNASRGELESFLNKLKEEAYPDLGSTNVELVDKLDDSFGYFDPNTNKVILARDSRPERLSGTLFHELGHAVDGADYESVEDDVFDPVKKSKLREKGIKSGSQLSRMNPYEVNEIIQSGHHASIPERKGSYGMSNLKNLMKGKNLRSMIGPVAGLGLGAVSALVSGDATAAIPLLGDSEPLGPEKGSIDDIIENPRNLSPEERKKALENLLKENGQDEI